MEPSTWRVAKSMGEVTPFSDVALSLLIIVISATTEDLSLGCATLVVLMATSSWNVLSRVPTEGDAIMDAHQIIMARAIPMRNWWSSTARSRTLHRADGESSENLQPSCSNTILVTWTPIFLWIPLNVHLTHANSILKQMLTLFNATAIQPTC